MNYSSRNLPENVKKLMSCEDRAALGVAGLAMLELISRQEIRSEKQLQNQIASWLRLRDLPFSHPRTDKKTTCAVGVEDFSVCFRGFYVALECKHGAGTQTDDQLKREASIKANGGRYEVVRSLGQVFAVLRDVVMPECPSLPHASPVASLEGREASDTPSSPSWVI